MTTSFLIDLRMPITRPTSLVIRLNLLLSIMNKSILLFLNMKLLLDQSPAFDTIDHGTLWDCRSSWFSIGSVVLDWFKSCLTDCSQCSNIGSILSEAKKLLHGVPQGTALGPVLFSTYYPLSDGIHNHPDIRFHILCKWHTVICSSYTHNNMIQTFEKLRKCLSKKWLSANNLKLDPDKTEFIIFGLKMQ